MTALAAFAKVRSVYQEWQAIHEKYGLKWTHDNDMQVFQAITEGKEDYNAMMDWVRRACGSIPPAYAYALRFNLLTGLRPSESLYSIGIIQSDLTSYMQPDGLLQHFKYAGIFLRRTKKAYISIGTDEVIKLGTIAKNCGYNPLRQMLKRNGLDANMAIAAPHLGRFSRPTE